MEKEMITIIVMYVYFGRFQHVRCVEIMNELLSFHTSRMFSQPVEPIRDNCPNYFKVIKNPMDLGTIMNKLNENKYKSVAEWKADVNLVWSNSFIFNPKTSLMRSITKELSDYFDSYITAKLRWAK